MPDAKNSTTDAISSAVPKRRKGMRSRSEEVEMPRCCADWTMRAVATAPGATQLTRMLSGPISCARKRVYWMSAVLAHAVPGQPPLSLRGIQSRS